MTAEALRALGNACRRRGELAQTDAARETLDLIGCAALDAAQDLDARALVQHGCTIDHRGIPAGRRCPACGAPRG